MFHAIFFLIRNSHWTGHPAFYLVTLTWCLYPLVYAVHIRLCKELVTSSKELRFVKDPHMRADSVLLWHHAPFSGPTKCMQPFASLTDAQSLAPQKSYQCISLYSSYHLHSALSLYFNGLFGFSFFSHSKDNVCVPPKLICCDLILTMMVFGGKTFGKRLSSEGGAFKNRISVLIKGTLESSLTPSTLWGHSE